MIGATAHELEGATRIRAPLCPNGPRLSASRPGIGDDQVQLPRRRDRHERRAAELRRVEQRDRAGRRAAGGVEHVGERPARGGQPGLHGDAGGRHERGVEAQPAQELQRPAPRDGARVLVELARADDHVELLGADLGGDHRRVGHERQLVRGIVHQAPRQRERARGRVEEDRRPAGDHRRRLLGDRGLRRPRLAGAVVPRGGVRVRPALVRERARAPAHALDQPLARQLLEVAMGRHRRHGVVARELGHGGAAAPLDLLEDLCAAQRCRKRAHGHAPRGRRAPYRCARSVLTDSSTSHE